MRLVFAVAVLLFASVASAQYPNRGYYRAAQPVFVAPYYDDVPSYRIESRTWNIGAFSTTETTVRPSYNSRPAWGPYYYGYGYGWW